MFVLPWGGRSGGALLPPPDGNGRRPVNRLFGFRGMTAGSKPQLGRPAQQRARIGSRRAAEPEGGAFDSFDEGW